MKTTELLNLYLTKKDTYGFTQTFIANKIGLHKYSISCFERGLRPLGKDSSCKLESFLKSL